jgi:serine/threonine protein kinase
MSLQALNKSPEERLPESRVQFYVAEIVLALSYLHQMGLMYRDLKVRRFCVLVVVAVACGGQCVGGVSFWLRGVRLACAVVSPLKHVHHCPSAERRRVVGCTSILQIDSLFLLLFPL